MHDQSWENLEAAALEHLGTHLGMGSCFLPRCAGKYLQSTGVTAGLSRMLGKELPKSQCPASTGLIQDHCCPQGYLAKESD